MSNVSLSTLRAWSCLLKMHMKGKLSKKFVHVLLWIFPVTSLLGFAVLERRMLCGPLASLITRCFGRLKRRPTTSFPLPHPLCWAEHGRAITSQAVVMMSPVSQDEPRNHGADCIDPCAWTEELAGKRGPAGLVSAGDVAHISLLFLCHM